MNEVKILGYRKFNSKDGKPFCILQVHSPFSDREIQYGACGNKVEELWLPPELHTLINPQCIGKAAQLSYTVNGRNAYVCGLTIK